MYIHNLDPVLLDFGFIAIRWYSLAYIFGIVIGWWLGKKIVKNFLLNVDFKFDVKEFDDLITYLIISIIVGGRLGYVLFYNFESLGRWNVFPRSFDWNNNRNTPFFD